VKANGIYASPFSCGFTLLHIPVSEIYTNSYGGKKNDGYAAITWTSSPASNDDYIKACPSWDKVLVFLYMGERPGVHFFTLAENHFF
jgi:hypothetical protein